MKVACLQFLTATSTGNQDITGSLNGEVPKAVFLSWSRSTSNAASSVGGIAGYGAATSSSDRWCVCSSSLDNVVTTVEKTRARADACYIQLNTNNGTLVSVADFVSFIPNGFRINWSTASATARYVQAWVLYGNDISAKAGIFTPDTTQNNSVNVSTSFLPSFLLLAHGHCDFNNTAVDNNRMGFGMARNASSIEQAANYRVAEHNVGTSNLAAFYSNTYAAIRTDIGGASSNEYAIDITAFSTSGFTATTRLANIPAANIDIGYLAVKCLNSCKISSILSAASTGNQAYTGIGFKPQALILSTSGTSSANTKITSGIGCEDVANGMSCPANQTCMIDAIRDNIGTSDATDRTLTSDIFTIMRSTAVFDIQGSLSSYDADGFTINFTTTTVQGYAGVLAIGPEKAANFMPFFEDIAA